MADWQNGSMSDWQNGRMANYFCPPCAVVECERECSHGEDYRLVRLSVIHYQVQRNAPVDHNVICQMGAQSYGSNRWETAILSLFPAT